MQKSPPPMILKGGYPPMTSLCYVVKNTIILAHCQFLCILYRELVDREKLACYIS